MKGIVVKSTGSSYWVRNSEGEVLECKAKGNLRLRGIRSTNPVAVGDRVDVCQQTDGTRWITDLDDRRNYIIRRSTNLSHESHILAANVDLACLVVTLSHPTTSTTFIDRFLATAEAYRVPVCLIFNKIDLLSDEEKELLDAYCALYRGIGYPVFCISARALDPAFLPSLIQLAEDKRTNKATNESPLLLFSGNSGVGKSTLLNAFFGKEMTRTGLISDAHDKGMHTTTFSELYALPATANHSQAWIVDTPGVKGFGLLNMQTEEVGHYFPDIFALSRECRFSNCTHTGEPGCAVLKAEEDGTLAPSRFASYLSILGDIDEEKYR